MNKITKKICTGMLSAFCMLSLSGCFSNVKFDQEDLDAVMEESREYFESQNNYSAEFARNYLLDYMAKGLSYCTYECQNITYTAEGIMYDFMGNVVEKDTLTLKTYKDGNTMKTYFKMEDPEETEAYIIVNSTTTTSGIDYEYKMYDVATKTYTELNVNSEDEEEDDDSDSGLLPIDSVLISLSHYGPLNTYGMFYPYISSNNDLNIVMDRVDKNKDLFTIVMEEGVLKFTFENGLLTSYEAYEVFEEDEWGDLVVMDSRSVMKTTISYDVSDFDVPNINSYTKVN